MKSSGFCVTQHGGIDPSSESARLVGQHASAYRFAERDVSGKTVLEIGHGDGYGSYRLAQSALKVTAVDLFEENVIAARKYSRANLQFLQCDATQLSFEDNSFDRICSFQVIEHIPRERLGRYAEEIRRVLRPAGRAYISTLNLKKNQKAGRSYQKSPHHDLEFTPDEFKKFFHAHFERPRILGLYPRGPLRWAELMKKSGIFKGLPGKFDPVRRYYGSITERDFMWVEKLYLEDCIDLMAVLEK